VFTGATFNGGTSTPTWALETEFYNTPTVSPSNAATVTSSGIMISDHYCSAITVTFTRKDTTASCILYLYQTKYFGTFYIKNINADKVITYNRYSLSPETPLYIQSQNSYNWYKWEFYQIEDIECFMIKSKYDNKYLSLSNNTVSLKSYPQYSCPLTARWMLLQDSDGGVRIVPCENICNMLYCENDEISSGTDVSLSANTNAASLNWYLLSANAKRTVINDDPDANSGYDRDDAVDYAIQYANTFNSYYDDFDRSHGDCTNFVSQCLYAGNLLFASAPTNFFNALLNHDDPQSWYYCPDYNLEWNNEQHYCGISFSWGNAENFRQHWGWSPLGENKRAYAYIQYESAADMLLDKEYLLSVIQPGDIIQQVNKDPTEMENEMTSTHSMFVYAVTEDNIYYCQHTGNGPEHFYDSYLEEQYLDTNVKSLFWDNPNSSTDSGLCDRYNDSESDFAFILISRKDAG